MLALLALDGCGDNITIPVDPGSLVEVRVSSTVGVLLDDLPAGPDGVRERVVPRVLFADPGFWIERAKLQLRLTALRLVYRGLYYAEELEKGALPLPPEDKWEIVLDPAAKRQTIDGHDLVTIGFTMRGTLLSDVDSPGVSEPALGTVGGSFHESFVFPIDPTLILQRTGFACIDEDQFPPDSVDAENAYQFYDDTCEVEDPLAVSCHLTTLPSESCIDAVKRGIGSVDSAVNFRRLKWNDAAAEAARTNDVTNPDAPDLKVLTTGFQSLSNNRIIYKYFQPDDCALNEEPACVGGPGWRRLIEFDSIDHNVGGKPIDIGPVDYFNEGLGGELIDHNVYSLSACHNHFHFLYYGDFGFGAGIDEHVQKNGFCLESTGRLSNHELSPLHTEFNCENQGVSPGWVDLYAAGLTCNWIDVTRIDTAVATVTAPLSFHSNPDGFICEGEPKLDSAGAQIFESTEFKTPTGAAVDRPACDQAAGSETNDVGTVDVTLPIQGGMVSSPCRDTQAFGGARNCGFTQQPTIRTCTAGATTTISCSGGTVAQPQVVRVCEASRALKTGVDCTFQDALANVVVEAGAKVVTFRCPTARDTREAGGKFTLYTAPVFEPDLARAITCN